MDGIATQAGMAAQGGNGLPLATHYAEIDFAQFSASPFRVKVAATLNAVPSSEETFLIAGLATRNDSWLVAGTKDSTLTSIASDQGVPFALTIDGVDMIGGTRGDVYNAICDGALHEIVVAASNRPLERYRFCRYRVTSFNLSDGLLKDVKIDIGDTGAWDAHFPLSNITDTRDLIGSYTVNIIAD